MNAADRAPDPSRKGVSVTELYADDRERVLREDWAPDAAHRLEARGGAEIFVLEGSIIESGETFSARDWLRLPAETKTDLSAGPNGAALWIKLGHLPFAASPNI